MWIRKSKVILRSALVGCVLGLAGGCGGGEDGELVEVDKEKEEALTEAMGSYYENPPAAPQ